MYINAFVPHIGEDVLHLAGGDSLVPTSIELKTSTPRLSGQLTLTLLMVSQPWALIDLIEEAAGQEADHENDD